MRVNPEKKEEKERVTQALLRATLELAAAHGFAGLGLREVSRAADIAPTSFYRHFADMEALGLGLIEGLVRPVVRGWVERAHGASKTARGLVDGIATYALAGAGEDRELMRFILAERVGAIPSFRAALRRELSAVSKALEDAVRAELPVGRPDVSAYAADAAVALLLEACGQVLDQGPEHEPELRGRLLAQMHALLSSAPSMRNP